MYVPMPVINIAIILGTRWRIRIFSVPIFGKKTVKRTPMISTKIGWKDCVSNTRATGASIKA